MGTSCARVTAPHRGVAGTSLYEAVGPDGELRPGIRVAIVGLMHGNEPVGGAVLDRLAEQAGRELRAGSVLAIRANLEAEALDLRHTPDGLDLNRLWDRDTLDRLFERMCGSTDGWAKRKAQLVEEGRWVELLY